MLLLCLIFFDDSFFVSIVESVLRFLFDKVLFYFIMVVDLLFC